MKQSLLNCPKEPYRIREHYPRHLFAVYKERSTLFRDFNTKTGKEYCLSTTKTCYYDQPRAAA